MKRIATINVNNDPDRLRTDRETWVCDQMAKSKLSDPNGMDQEG